MNRLPILLFLLYLLSAGSANAVMVEPSDASFVSSFASNYVFDINHVLDINNDENSIKTQSKFTQASQYTSETDNSIPPTPWIVGLGLCLVFLGYKMKNRAD